ncbi:MAG: hypothetical protein HPY57_15120 [Ignavibacteria bacterium]|nr:hypothetical protein [Ignavibacteria bacterium]
MIINKTNYGLRFPVLIKIGITTNSSRNGNEPCDVYKLDWSDFNNQTKLKHKEWIKSFKERFKRDYTEPLENYYMNLMTEQEFIIPDYYLTKIILEKIPNNQKLKIYKLIDRIDVDNTKREVRCFSNIRLNSRERKLNRILTIK